LPSAEEGALVKSSDDLLREFFLARHDRNRLRSERAGLLCERSEAMTLDAVEDACAKELADPLWNGSLHVHEAKEPCWKAARKWEETNYRSRFYFDPPMAEWCETCRRRQEVSDAYRASVRKHGGALRGLLRRGKAVAKDGLPQAHGSPGITPAIHPNGERAGKPDPS
jgi:hypothetical protein